MIKKAGRSFTTAYLLLIFGIYPLYMHRGYVDIAQAKYHFFIYCSLAGLVILTAAGAACGGQALWRRIRHREAYLITWDSVSLTDMFVILYATEIFISYVFSCDRKEAFGGTQGWYMGLVLLLVLCALYFYISRLWSGSKGVWHAAVLTSGIVFLLGILDRFSVYLIPLETRNPAFISTLGNINWFCGYLSVTAPIGISLFVFGSGKKKVYGVYAFFVFLAGFCQGGSSIFLFFGVLFYSLLWIAVKKRMWIENYFLLLFLWSMSAGTMTAVQLIIKDGYNYDPDSFCVRAAGSPLTLLAGIGALGIYVFLRIRKEGEISSKMQGTVHKVMILMLMAGILGYLILAMPGNKPGAPGAGRLEIFSFGEAWGNGRGAAITGSIEAYRQMPFFRKLFGAGPDCFSVYVYSLEEVAQMLRANFGSNRLTNAHNELLTCLINTGFAGTCLFAGTFAFFAGSCMRKGKENPTFYLFAVCIICYFVHNMVSFAQVLNFPYLFLLLGMGENMKRNQKF